MTEIILPAIRSHVGDWVFYSATLSFKNIKDLIKDPDEIHERQKLSDWIQREAISKHASDIANYIIENEQRFLGSLIVGVYDGNPQWSPLNVSFHREHIEVTDEQKEELEGKLGYLAFSGGEKLFAIDGQHRVSGIKEVLDYPDIDPSIMNNEVGALFVSHKETIEGRERTRRLFTTVNKKAKRVSEAAIIALDEDNGFAIITRRLIENHSLFEDAKDHLSYSGSAPIQSEHPSHLTSIIALNNIVMELYNGNKKAFKESRPSESSLQEHYTLCLDFINYLLENVPEYIDVFTNSNSRVNEHRNHLLFRPVGQRVLARATSVLMARDNTLGESLDKLLACNLELNSKEWHYILWDPIENTIKNENKRVAIAETRLLNMAGESAKTRKNQENLDSLLASISS